MANSKNHKFEIRLSMDNNVIASRGRWVETYPESIIYSLRLNKLLNDMCDIVEDALRENDIERVWGIMEGFDHHLRRTRQNNKQYRKDNSSTQDSNNHANSSYDDRSRRVPRND
jgi:hypothetical protein